MDEDHIALALNQISINDEKFIYAKHVVLGYRIGTKEYSVGKEEVLEGFDNSGLEGSGEKLLHLLKRVGVENILVVVAIWYYGVGEKNGIGVFAQVVYSINFRSLI
jgi:hypothetical protein